MFVEITRLIIVFLATAGGYAGGRAVRPSGSAPLVGAVLGLLVGYVGGGILGRLLRSAMGIAERRLANTPAPKLLAGAVGGLAGGGLVAVCCFPVALLLPPVIGWLALMFLVWVGAAAGFSVAAGKSEHFLAMAGLSSRPLVRALPYGGQFADSGAALLDTSAIIDGRLLPLVRNGILRGALLVPQFVLDELQSIADAADPVRRRRGRRGLDLLDALQRQPTTEVHLLEDEVVEHAEVDAKLVALARRLEVILVTVDGPLEKVASLQGVRVLNLDSLAEGMRRIHVPGEVICLPITRVGKEPGQGVGFLADGTMVVVGEAAELVGQEVDVRVTGNVQTSVGQMLFASVAAE